MFICCWHFSCLLPHTERETLKHRSSRSSTVFLTFQLQDSLSLSELSWGWTSFSSDLSLNITLEFLSAVGPDCVKSTTLTDRLMELSETITILLSLPKSRPRRAAQVLRYGCWGQLDFDFKEVKSTEAINYPATMRRWLQGCSYPSWFLSSLWHDTMSVSSCVCVCRCVFHDSALPHCVILHRSRWALSIKYSFFAQSPGAHSTTRYKGYTAPLLQIEHNLLPCRFLRALQGICCKNDLTFLCVPSHTIQTTALQYVSISGADATHITHLEITS